MQITTCKIKSNCPKCFLLMTTEMDLEENTTTLIYINNNKAKIKFLFTHLVKWRAYNDISIPPNTLECPYIIDIVTTFSIQFKKAIWEEKTLWLRFCLTHWGRVTHICIGKLTIMGSDNGLSPERRQAIIWTNAAILLIAPWEQTSVKFQTKFKHLYIWKCRLRNVVHFVTASMC